MQPERRRLNLSFAMESQRQRDAWEKLSSIPRGQRTEAVCGMICGYMAQSELLNAVRETIRVELSGITTYSPAEQKKNERSGETEGIDDDVLAFLSALQKEGE